MTHTHTHTHTHPHTHTHTHTNTHLHTHTLTHSHNRLCTLTLLFQEYIAYPIENLLSDFGGILGLYLGVSVLTLAEFFKALHNFVSVKLATKKINSEVTKLP